MSYLNNIKNGAVILLTSLAIGACSLTDPIVNRVNKLRNIYDEQGNTHAHRWKASYLPSEEWCAFLYRDKLLNTQEDDWIPFFQGLALKIGEQELNRRRKDIPHKYDNELFTFREQDEFCHEIDMIGFNLYDLDHHQVAIPEETQEKLESLLQERDQSEIKFLEDLNLYYIRPEDMKLSDRFRTYPKSGFKFD